MPNKKLHMRAITLLSLLAITPLLVTMACSKERSMTMSEATSGRPYPLSLTLSEMTQSDWRRMNIDGQIAPNALGLGNAFLGGIIASLFGGNPQMSDFKDLLYLYTQGQEVTIGGDKYLVAYRIDTNYLQEKIEERAKSPNPIIHSPDSASSSEPIIKNLGETKMGLVLIKFSQINSLSQMEPFDYKTWEAKHKQEAEKKQVLEAPEASSKNLKSLGTALMMYAQDYDETFPNMKTAEEAKALLMPYIKDEKFFHQPDTNALYQPIPEISYKSLATIESPADTLAYYETTPMADQKRGVVFADGHVKRLTEAEWQALQAKVFHVKQ
jgi:prepilin-type processing-associated H-X9-DG protein